MELKIKGNEHNIYVCNKLCSLQIPKGDFYIHGLLVQDGIIDPTRHVKNTKTLATYENQHKLKVKYNGYKDSNGISRTYVLDKIHVTSSSYAFDDILPEVEFKYEFHSVHNPSYKLFVSSFGMTHTQHENKDITVFVDKLMKMKNRKDIKWDVKIFFPRNKTFFTYNVKDNIHILFQDFFKIHDYQWKELSKYMKPKKKYKPLSEDITLYINEDDTQYYYESVIEPSYKHQYIRTKEHFQEPSSNILSNILFYILSIFVGCLVLYLIWRII